MKLYYFDMYGRAECMRLLMTHAKVPYEDSPVTKEIIAKMAAEGQLEFDKVPAIEKDGKFYCETKAMLRFMGKKHGYYPEDPMAAWRVDSIMDALDDAHQSLVKVFFSQNEEEKKEAGIKATTEVLPKFLSKLDKILAANVTQDYLVGDKITIADFFVGSWVYSMIRNPNNPGHAMLGGLLDPHENVKKWADNFAKVNEERLSSRPAKPY
mmetsp:Transcript_23863/g.18215  ORF Transcript_23863/g.18215 Transcript_23863/m.18215 type:complete len:210 (-) Transcript_23863:77-706(-)